MDLDEQKAMDEAAKKASEREWFWKKLGLFVLYILKKPFVETWSFIKGFFTKVAHSAEKDRSWATTFLYLTIIVYLTGYKIPATIFLLLAIIALIKAEWASGEFIHEYRKSYKEKARKRIEQLEGKQ